MSKLVVFHGDAVESEIHLGSQPVRIGRDSHNDVVLTDKSVTRFHAEVRPEGGSYVIVDLKSRNGVWIKGKQIRSRAALTLGVPVTIGAYELTLEDDLSTSDFGETPAVHQTVATRAAVRNSDRPSGSATRRWSVPSPADTAQRTALFWSGLVLMTLLLCGITYAVVRYRSQPQTVAAAVQPDAPPAPQPAAAPLPTEDPKKLAIDRHLADARAAIESRDYDAALVDHVSPVLELDPANAEALELKRQIDAAKAAAAAPPAVASKPAPPVEPETPGIPRRAGEGSTEYTARVARVKTNFFEGNRNLERQDYANALLRFEAVERDQKGYQGVDSLITDTVNRRRQAVEDAIDNGQKNEAAGKLSDALKWYQQAIRFDANSTSAHEKAQAITERLTKDGLDAFTRAEVFRKRNDFAKAIEFYKQAADLLPSGHEKSREAQQWLEKLKP